MSDPWAEFRVKPSAPAGGDPWAEFRVKPVDQAPLPEQAPSPASAMPKVGETWKDPETGETRLIVEPSISRKPGEWTLADVESRMATLAKGSPQLPEVGNLGPTTVEPSDPAALAEAARNDEFTQRVLAENPSPLTIQVVGRQRASDRSALETGAWEAANTFAVGLPRLAKAAMSSTPLDAEHEIEKAADAAARVEHPRAAQAGQMVGIAGQALATPAAAVATPLRAAVTGGALSGIQTAADTRGDIAETVKSAATGAALGAGAAKIAGAPQTTSRQFIAENAPTAEALKQFARESYEAARASGVRYAPEAIANTLRNTAQTLWTEGFRPINQPKSFALLKEISKLKDGGDVADLESLRKAAQRIAADHTESASAGIIRRAIDDLMDNTTPSDVLAGDPQAAAAAIKDARGNYGAAKRSEMLSEAMENARLDAQKTGGSLEGTLRNQFRSLLRNKEAMRGFSDQEKAAIRAVVRGGPVQNVARILGKMSPQNPVAASLLTALGYNVVGASIVALPVAAAAARRYTERTAERKASFAEALTRARAPAYSAQVDALLANAQRQQLPPQGLVLAQRLMDLATRQPERTR